MIFLLVLSLVPSLALEPSLTAVENTKTLILQRDQRAAYALIIKNLGEVDTFTIRIENGFALRLAGILVNPEESSIRLGPGESKEVSIYASILEKALPGSYQIMIIAESTKGEKSYYPLNLEIRSLEPVVLQLSKEESYEPCEIKIGVSVFNALDKKLQNLWIRFEIGEIEKAILLGDLGAKETLNRTLTFSLPSTTKPGKYFVTASIRNRKEYTQEKFWLEIKEYKPPLKVEQFSEMKLDGYYTSFKFENQGNVPRTTEKEIRVSKLVSWLFKPITPAKIKKEEQIVYQWTIKLEPGETKIVSYKFWYLPLYVIAAVIGGILYFGYQYTLTPIITKKVVQEETIEKPTESRVILTINNRSNRKLKDVKVKDLIPLISRDLKDYGTIEPKKTVKTNRGKLLVWELKSLDPKEERVLSYKMKNVLGVIGGLRLPKAALYYKIDGKERERYSNTVGLN